MNQPSRRVWRPYRTRQALGLAALALVLALGPALPGLPPVPTAEAKPTTLEKGIGDFNEVTPEMQKALNKGLDFLAQGILGSGSGAPPGSYPLAVTSLSGMAFLANGETPTRGPHALALKRATNFVLSQANPTTGLISEPQRSGLMYSHGLATLFLAEVYGTTRDRKVRRALRQAVRLIERTQSTAGGWTYQPTPTGGKDMSITVCQTMALRAARNAGIAVSPVVVQKAVDCVVNARTPRTPPADFRKGLGFTYQSGGGGGPTWPVTSGSLCILYGLGQAKDTGAKTPEKNPSLLIKPALEFVLTRVSKLRSGQLPDGGHKFYGNYYAVQAMAHAGQERYWGTWFPAVRDTLIKMQGGGKNWSGEISPYYCTAMACLILSVPYQYLPTFEN